MTESNHPRDVLSAKDAVGELKWPRLTDDERRTHTLAARLGRQRAEKDAQQTDQCGLPPEPPIDPDLLRERIAREAALHGLGCIGGVGDRSPPNERWDQDEWERRILECVPGAVAEQCYRLADAIIALKAGKAEGKSNGR